MGDIRLEELRQVVKDLWSELGRDVNKLNIDNLPADELIRAQRQLRTIQMSFDMLLKQDGNYNMAIGLLTEVFVNEENERTKETPSGNGGR